MTTTPIGREKNLVAAVNHAHTAIKNVTKELEEIGEFDEAMQHRVIDYLRTSVDDAQRYLTYLQGRNSQKFSLDWRPPHPPSTQLPPIPLKRTAAEQSIPIHVIEAESPTHGVNVTTQGVSVTRRARARVFNPEGKRVFAECTDTIALTSDLMGVDGADFLDEGPSAQQDATVANEPDFA